MSKSTTDNMNGLTPFANGGCQSLLQSTRMGSHPLLMVDVEVYYSQREWVYTLCKGCDCSRLWHLPIAKGVNPFLLTVNRLYKDCGPSPMNIFCKHFACFLSERGGIDTSTAFYNCLTLNHLKLQHICHTVA